MNNDWNENEKKNPNYTFFCLQTPYLENEARYIDDVVSAAEHNKFDNGTGGNGKLLPVMVS